MPTYTTPAGTAGEDRITSPVSNVHRIFLLCVSRAITRRPAVPKKTMPPATAGRRENTTAGALLPERLAGRGVDGQEPTVVRSEVQPAIDDGRRAEQRRAQVDLPPDRRTGTDRTGRGAGVARIAVGHGPVVPSGHGADICLRRPQESCGAEIPERQPPDREQDQEKQADAPGHSSESGASPGRAYLNG